MATCCVNTERSKEYEPSLLVELDVVDENIPLLEILL
jgi:hypothetical protein